MEFLGYERPDGSVGVRNKVLVMSSVFCTGPIPERVESLVKNVVGVRYDRCVCDDVTMKQLEGVGKNPNVAAVLIVGHEAGGVNPHSLADRISRSGKPVECITVRESGGTISTLARATGIAHRLAIECSKVRIKSFDIDNLIIGVKCGCSDSTSGIASNPAVGVAVDKLIKNGGTAIFGEPLECAGCESILAKRAINTNVGQSTIEAISNMISIFNERSRKGAEHLAANRKSYTTTAMSPGNVDGGLTTIEEKSLGAIQKSGSMPIQGVLKTAEKPQGKGLYFMPNIGIIGTDTGDIYGFVAGGAQIVVFSTGMGPGFGNAISPVIKVTGNPDTYMKMKDNIDVNAGTIIDGRESIHEVGEKIFQEIIDVASGKFTKSEALKFEEFYLLMDYNTLF